MADNSSETSVARKDEQAMQSMSERQSQQEGDESVEYAKDNVAGSSDSPSQSSFPMPCQPHAPYPPHQSTSATGLLQYARMNANPFAKVTSPSSSSSSSCSATAAGGQQEGQSKTTAVAGAVPAVSSTGSCAQSPAAHSILRPSVLARAATATAASTNSSSGGGVSGNNNKGPVSASSFILKPAKLTVTSASSSNSTGAIPQSQQNDDTLRSSASTEVHTHTADSTIAKPLPLTTDNGTGETVQDVTSNNVRSQVLEECPTAVMDPSQKQSEALPIPSTTEQPPSAQEQPVASADCSAAEAVAAAAGSGSGGGFVFGSNMSERVVNAEVAPSSDDDGDSDTAAKVGNKTGVEETEGDVSGSKEDCSSSRQQLKLEESAREYEAKIDQGKTRYEEVKVVTGEEDETTALQINCKLYMFCKDKHEWFQRGEGVLRLNDKRIANTTSANPNTTATVHSRLVFRTHGTFKLWLNDNIRADMLLDKASEKSIRFSARDIVTDGLMKMYLAKGNSKDMETLHSAIFNRVAVLASAAAAAATSDTDPTSSASSNPQQGHKRLTPSDTSDDASHSKRAKPDVTHNPNHTHGSSVADTIAITNSESSNSSKGSDVQT